MSIACLDQWIVGRLSREIFACFDFVIDLRSKLGFEGLKLWVLINLKNKKKMI
jgi:hypothetical protein